MKETSNSQNNTTIGTQLLSPTELATLQTCYREILRVCDFDQDTIKKVRQALRELVDAGCFDRDKNGIHGIIRAAEVSLIATQSIGLGTEAVLATLFYRAVHKGKLSLDEMERIVGKPTRDIVSLLLEISDVYVHAASIRSKGFDSFLLSVAKDIRVVLIVIADRLFQLRSAKMIVAPEDLTDLVAEISYIYAPLSHRMGLYAIKSEMEDLCLKHSDSQSFAFIKQKLGETKASRDAYVKSFIGPLEQRLKEELPSIQFDIKGRTKSISSIRNKLIKQRVEFEQIYDLFAIRIIVHCLPQEERAICWQVYSIVTDMYKPNPERLKDWISIPKSNGYESLHTTVMGPEQRWVEVQIRSERMDIVAEKGMAAHWRYKGIQAQTGLDELLLSIRETIEAKRLQPHEEAEHMRNLRTSIETDDIYAFTPKGEIKKLPKGATVLDFAFSIHSDVGCKASAGIVNGKNQALRHKLANGDIVSIITDSRQTPRKDWLRIVVSPRAKNKLRQELRKQEEANRDIARELLLRRLKNRKLSWDESVLTTIVKQKGFKTLGDFLNQLADDRVDLMAILDIYSQALDESKERPLAHSAESTILTDTNKQSTSKYPQSLGDRLIIDQGQSGIAYQLAACCNPIYGDPIFAYVSANGIKIHRTACPNAPDLLQRFGYRVLSAQWSGEESGGYESVIRVTGQEQVSNISQIVSIIKREDSVSLSRYTVDSSDGLFTALFTLRVPNEGKLSEIIKLIAGLKGIKSAQRN